MYLTLDKWLSQFKSKNISYPDFVKKLRIKKSNGDILLVTDIKDKKISKGSQIVPIRDFMFLASEFYKDNEGSYPDIVIYLSLHAINRRADHIDKALNVLRINESDSVVSVQEEREPMFGYSKEGLNLINPGRFKDLSYQDEQLYKFNGCLIATWWEVLQTHGLFGEKISSIEMSYEDSFQVKSKSMLKYLEV